MIRSRAAKILTGFGVLALVMAESRGSQAQSTPTTVPETAVTRTAPPSTVPAKSVGQPAPVLRRGSGQILPLTRTARDLELRKTLGLANDDRLLVIGEADTAKRRADGDDNAGVVLSDSEYQKFLRWKSLVDDPGFVNSVIDRKDRISDREVSFDINNPTVTLYATDRATPADLTSLRSARSDLNVMVKPGRHSANDIEALRNELAVKIALKGSSKPLSEVPNSTPTPDGTAIPKLEDAKNNGPVLASTGLFEEFELAGMEVVHVRAEPQRIKVVVDKNSTIKASEAKRHPKIAAALKVKGEDLFEFVEGSKPKPKAATRESDPGQMKAGLSMTMANGNIGGPCTSNVSVRYGGYSYLVTAGHCFYPSGTPGDQPGPIAPNWQLLRFSHQGREFGVGTNAYMNLSLGRDIGLIYLWQPGSASEYFNLNPSPGVTRHYALQYAPQGSYQYSASSSWGCIEGASPDRALVGGVGADRCGPIVANSNNWSMTEIFVATCGGDSGGLLHYADEPLGILSAADVPVPGTNDQCGSRSEFAKLYPNLNTWVNPSVVLRNSPTSAPNSYLPAVSVKLVATHSGLCLDAAYGSLSSGTAINQYPCHGQGSQRWFFQPRNDLNDGDIWDVIRNAGGPSGSFAQLGVQGFTPSWGSPVIHGGGAWRISNQNTNGFTLNPYNGTGFCLDVPGSSGGVVQVVTWGCTSNPNQRWRIEG